jgi:hypothetical protein
LPSTARVPAVTACRVARFGVAVQLAEQGKRARRSQENRRSGATFHKITGSGQNGHLSYPVCRAPGEPPQPAPGPGPRTAQYRATRSIGNRPSAVPPPRRWPATSERTPLKAALTLRLPPVIHTHASCPQSVRRVVACAAGSPAASSRRSSRNGEAEMESGLWLRSGGRSRGTSGRRPWAGGDGGVDALRSPFCRAARSARGVAGDHLSPPRRGRPRPPAGGARDAPDVAQQRDCAGVGPLQDH